MNVYDDPTPMIESKIITDYEYDAGVCRFYSEQRNGVNAWYCVYKDVTYVLGKNTNTKSKSILKELGKSPTEVARFMSVEVANIGSDWYSAVDGFSSITVKKIDKTQNKTTINQTKYVPTEKQTIITSYQDSSKEIKELKIQIDDLEVHHDNIIEYFIANLAELSSQFVEFVKKTTKNSKDSEELDFIEKIETKQKDIRSYLRKKSELTDTEKRLREAREKKEKEEREKKEKEEREKKEKEEREKEGETLPKSDPMPTKDQVQIGIFKGVEKTNFDSFINMLKNNNKNMQNIENTINNITTKRELNKYLNLNFVGIMKEIKDLTIIDAIQ